VSRPSIFDDALVRPDLFIWFGIDEAAFDRWLISLPFRVHPSLVSFWRRTGGGDLFESETILGPLRADPADNLLEVNNFRWENGLPSNLLLFNVGAFTSASRPDEPQIVTLRNGSFEIEKSYHTLDDWYEDTLRAEFGARYGLPSKRRSRQTFGVLR
jgi:hypothetical protein